MHSKLRAESQKVSRGIARQSTNPRSTTESGTASRKKPYCFFTKKSQVEELENRDIYSPELHRADSPCMKICSV